MQSNLIITAAAKLSDRDLLRHLGVLAGRERLVTVELIVHLAELDKRKLYRGEGYGSLFSYCTNALRLSEHATYKRIVAARACRRYPVLLERLSDGSLNLSTLRLLAPHLTPENLVAVVAEAAGRCKREVEALVARLVPQPDVGPSIRRLPRNGAAVEAPTLRLLPAAAAVPVVEARAAELSLGARRPVTNDLPLSPVSLVPDVASLAVIAKAPHAVVAPLAPERYRIQFTVSQETHETLRQVQDLLRREIPDGNLATIFDRALQLLLEHTARKKLAATGNPRPDGGSQVPRSRHLPARLVRAVWKRDGGQCAFVAKNGRRCSERAFLEFHHVDAFGLGGETTEANVSLRCRTHNQYEAELVFGRYEPTARDSRPANAHVRCLPRVMGREA